MTWRSTARPAAALILSPLVSPPIHGGETRAVAGQEASGAIAQPPSCLKKAGHVHSALCSCPRARAQTRQEHCDGGKPLATAPELTSPGEIYELLQDSWSAACNLCLARPSLVVQAPGQEGDSGAARGRRLSRAGLCPRPRGPLLVSCRPHTPTLRDAGVCGGSRGPCGVPAASSVAPCLNKDRGSTSSC